MSDPRTYHVEQDKDGFLIVDDFEEEVEPTRRYSSVKSAEAAIAEMVENYDPDVPGWEGGFAENH
jgi:hypothetical protein